MRPPKLYIKFFLSFTFILIVTLLMIYGLFKITEERARVRFFREQVRLYTFERVLLLRELIEEKIRAKSADTLSEVTDKSIQSLIDNIAKIDTAKVWINNNNRTLLKSFKGGIPDKIKNLPDENRFV